MKTIKIRIYNKYLENLRYRKIVGCFEQWFLLKSCNICEQGPPLLMMHWTSFVVFYKLRILVGNYKCLSQLL